MDGDPEANYAHFALQKLHILPSVFCDLDDYEKAFIIASINCRVESEKKQMKDAKKKR